MEIAFSSELWKFIQQFRFVHLAMHFLIRLFIWFVCFTFRFLSKIFNE